MDAYDEIHGEHPGDMYDTKTPVGWELYDMENDPYELENIYNKPEYQEVVKEVRKTLMDTKEYYCDTDDKYPELVKRYNESISVG